MHGSPTRVLPSPPYCPSHFRTLSPALTSVSSNSAFVTMSRHPPGMLFVFPPRREYVLDGHLGTSPPKGLRTVFSLKLSLVLFYTQKKKSCFYTLFLHIFRSISRDQSEATLGTDVWCAGRGGPERRGGSASVHYCCACKVVCCSERIHRVALDTHASCAAI